MNSEADTHHTRKMLEGLDCLVVQDIVLTDTAKVADVVLPGTASWCESEGTVTNSERRVQRVRKAIDPPEGARDDIWIIAELARRLGYDWGDPTAEDLWNELRELSPMHRGMSYEKLERLGGVQWPCPDEESEGTLFLHARLWEEDPAKRGKPAPFHLVEQDDPLDTLTDEYPIRLTTGRRLDSYNTGVASSQFATPLRRQGDDQPVAGGRGAARPRRGRRLGTDHLAARLDHRPGARGRDAARRARVHDAALPRPGGDQRPHPRHLGPEVGHRGVQGDRDPGGEGVAPRRPPPPGAAERQLEVDTLVDLRLTAKAPATDEERAAVDAVLGPAGLRLGGRRSAPRADAHVAFGGRAARARRHLLITVLHAVQERAGWISPGALDYVRERLTVPPAEAYGVASFYALFRTKPSPGAVVHVCDDVACQVGRRGGTVRRDDPPLRQRGHASRRFERHRRHLAALPVPRPVRPRLGRADPAGGRGAAQARPRPGHPDAVWQALTGGEPAAEVPLGVLVPQLSLCIIPNGCG